MQCHENHTNAGLVESLLARASRFHLHPQGQLLFALKVGDDLVQLLLQNGVVFWQGADVREGLFGLRMTILFDEPARRFVLEEDEEEEKAWQHLQSKRDAPLCRVGGAGNLSANAVVDEVGDHYAGDVEKLHAIYNTVSVRFNVFGERLGWFI